MFLVFGYLGSARVLAEKRTAHTHTTTAGQAVRDTLDPSTSSRAYGMLCMLCVRVYVCLVWSEPILFHWR